MPYFALRNLDTHTLEVVFSQTMTALKRDYLENSSVSPYELVTKRSFETEQGALDFIKKGAPSTGLAKPADNSAQRLNEQFKNQQKRTESVHEKANADTGAEATAEVDETKAKVEDKRAEADTKKPASPQERIKSADGMIDSVADKIRSEMEGQAAEVRDVFENAGRSPDSELQELINRNKGIFGEETVAAPDTSLDSEKIQVEDKRLSPLDRLRQEWQESNKSKPLTERESLIDWAARLDPNKLPTDRRAALIGLLKSAPKSSYPTYGYISGGEQLSSADANKRRENLEKLKGETNKAVAPDKPATEVSRPEFPNRTTLTIAGSGHRPNKMFLPDWFGGRGWEVFDPSKTMAGVRVVEEELKLRLQNHQRLRVIVGMAQGFDLMLGRAALNLKQQGLPVDIIAALPYEGHGADWSNKAKFSMGTYYDWHQAVMRGANEVHIGASPDPTKPRSVADALNKRNTYMVQQADLLLAFWNGTPGGTQNAVRDARELRVPIQNIYRQVTDALRTTAPPDQRSSSIIIDKDRTTGNMTTRTSAIPTGREPYEAQSSFRYERFGPERAYKQTPFERLADAVAESKRTGGTVIPEGAGAILRQDITRQPLTFGQSIPYGKAQRQAFTTEKAWNDYKASLRSLGEQKQHVQQGIIFGPDQTTEKVDPDRTTVRKDQNGFAYNTENSVSTQPDDQQNKSLNHQFENDRSTNAIDRPTVIQRDSVPRQQTQWTTQVKEFGYSQYGAAKTFRDQLNKRINPDDPQARQRTAWINPVKSGATTTAWQVSWKTLDTQENAENRAPGPRSLPSYDDEEPRTAHEPPKESRGYRPRRTTVESALKRDAQRLNQQVEPVPDSTSTHPNRDTMAQTFERPTRPQRPRVNLNNINRPHPNSPGTEPIEGKSQKTAPPAPEAPSGSDVEPTTIRPRRPRKPMVNPVQIDTSAPTPAGVAPESLTHNTLASADAHVCPRCQGRGARPEIKSWVASGQRIDPSKPAGFCFACNGTGRIDEAQPGEFKRRGKRAATPTAESEGHDPVAGRGRKAMPSYGEETYRREIPRQPNVWEMRARTTIGFTGRGLYGMLGQALLGAGMAQVMTPGGTRDQGSRDSFAVAAEGAMSNLAILNPQIGRSMIKSQLSMTTRDELHATVAAIGTAVVGGAVASTITDRIVSRRVGPAAGTLAGFAAGAAVWAGVEVVKSIFLDLRNRSREVDQVNKLLTESRIARSVTGDRLSAQVDEPSMIDLVFTDEDGDPLEVDFDDEQTRDIFSVEDADGEELPFSVESTVPG